MRPLELYKFTMDGKQWTYTSCDDPITYDGDVYLPRAIGRGGLESKNELSKANLEVRLDTMDQLSRFILQANQERVIGLTLFIQTHLGTDTAWKGRLSSSKPTDASIVMTFESVFTSLRRPGLRGRFQKSCRHALYHRGCTLNPEDFATVVQLKQVQGTSITVQGTFPTEAGYYIGGMLRGPDGTLGFIIAHTGDSFTLQHPMPSLRSAISAGYGSQYGNDYGGPSVTLYPGCDHSRKTCNSKFSNLPNYGGFDWIPEKNPMGGSSII